MIVRLGLVLLVLLLAIVNFGCSGSVAGTPTVNAALVAPSITTQPASQTISSGQTATLTVVATGTSPLSYQWYQGNSGNTATPVGANSSSHTTPSLTATTSYWVRVSNSAGIADLNRCSRSISCQCKTAFIRN